MRPLSDTITRLAKWNGGNVAMGAATADGRLEELRDFGANPGALRAYTYFPESLPDGAALVVVLHGCTQTAAGYDIGAGWSEMADRHGFALLFPEQQRGNNPNLCFNWFAREDSRRDGGEALSIRRMIAALTAAHPIDPARIYVTGLSAGGAMASVMLASYPELFAGGAIIAGLPYGCASTVPEAFDRMRGHGIPGEAELSALVRGASSHSGRWPTISVWHGSADATVSPANATAIVDQWRALHRAGPRPDRTETVDGQTRRVWRDPAGREVIEQYSIVGLGHGTPLDTSGKEGCGRAGPFMLEAGISSTRHICRVWGLTDARDGAVRGARRAGSAPVPKLARDTSSAAATSGGVSKVIEDALRAAGLMQ